MSQSELDLGSLHPKQTLAFESLATEILYGGAAGGGKSHLFRAGAIVWMSEIPGLQVYLFRRIRGDLIKNHMEGPKGFRNMLAPWTSVGLVDIVENELRWWNGAKLYLCHCKDENDVYQYQGAEMHLLLIDELTQWLASMYYYLRTRVRAPGLVLPEKYKGMFPRILSGANPGNIGHQWVKSDWIDGHQPLEIWKAPRSSGGMLRQYIPARLEDNPTMALDDPEYEQRLEGIGSAELVRAYRHGDWNVIAGAYFDNWRTDQHVIPRFTPPKTWTRFRSMDWGSYRPFSIGWWVVAEDEWVTLADGTERKFQRGALIRYREWYGCEPGKPNTGVKLDIEEVARGIKMREAGESVDERMCVADPSMWKHDGGPSLIERMAAMGVKFREADNARVAGWQQMRARLNGENGRPLIFCTQDCTDSVRTIPPLQHDKHKVEDVDSDGEDHAADDWRYACMSRPLSKIKVAKPSGPTPWTLDWIIQNDGK